MEDGTTIRPILLKNRHIEGHISINYKIFGSYLIFVA